MHVYIYICFFKNYESFQTKKYKEKWKSDVITEFMKKNLYIKISESSLRIKYLVLSLMI